LPGFTSVATAVAAVVSKAAVGKAVVITDGVPSEVAAGAYCSSGKLTDEGSNG